jgi:metallophosphoesterase (TIGR00282 family)
VLLLGDVIGSPGRKAVEALLPDLRDERGIDFATANGENLAGGMGLTPSTAEALFAAGVDVITSGNHIWDKREILPFLDASERVLRPHNYGTHDVPGRGWGLYQALDGTDLAVLNFQGRTYMQPIENPFTEFDRLVDEASEALPPVRLVDFHCELTSEKNAFGLHLDGRASVVVGTHTHIVTADERILPGGTAYQTDLGMTGPIWSVIGFKPDTVLPRFINALPTRFEVGDGAVILNALQVDIDPATGRAIACERVQRLWEP